MDAGHETDWTIGELADAAGVTVRTIRHYETVGLLPRTGRSDGGHRRFGRPALQRVRRILILRALGFDLATIGRLLAAESPAALLETSRRRLERAEVEFEVAQRLRERLRRIVRLLECTGETSMDELIDDMETGDVTVKLTRIYTKLGDAGETHRADTRRDGRQWQTPAPAHAALSTIARDAIELFGGTGANRIRECASPDCGFLFFDDSRPGTRRWCSMNRCGNRAKVGRYRRRVAGSTA